MIKQLRLKGLPPEDVAKLNKRFSELELKVGTTGGSYTTINETNVNLSDIILYVNSKYELPSIGDANYIYITKDEYAMYLWDSLSVTYQVLGFSSSEIETITGGNATTDFINE